jgi:oligopeptide/dipeptide ABC transporter ATP-binding protein
MTIGKQIAESVRLHRRVSRAAALERAAEVLDLVRMPRPRERLSDYPHLLSGGLRQRVMIAMALACEPTLLIADEPTTALDVTTQAQILSLLDDLRSKLGMAMILITHDMGVIAGRTDRTVVVYAGQVVETADTAQLFANMRHPYSEALLASIPQLDQDKTQRLYSIPGHPSHLTHPPEACRFAARCAYATELCRTETPPLDGPDPAHLFACHYPRQTSVEEIAGAGHLIAAAAATSVESQPQTEVSADERSVFDDVPAPAEAALKDLAGHPDSGASAAVSAGDHPAQASAGATPVLEYRRVTKEFGVTAGPLQRKVGTLKAVTEVSLSIQAGETVGIVGESGCGKTTLGRLGVALETPTGGQVLYQGVDLASLSSRQLRRTRRNLQFMFQDPFASLDPRMRVDSIIAEPLVIQGQMHAKARKARVRELLDEVGMSQKAAELFPHEFSGGQRQRIGLARALALNPAVIVADEPVSALDVSIRSQILNLMKRLQAHHGLTYLLISHDLSVVRYLADRIAVMYLGQLIETGGTDDVYNRPAHPYTVGLLETIPVPKPDIERAKRGAAVKGELPSPLNPPSGCRFRTRCPRAQQRCADEAPEMTPFGDEHLAACHFPMQSPVTLAVKNARLDQNPPNDLRRSSCAII